MPDAVPEDWTVSPKSPHAAGNAGTKNPASSRLLQCEDYRCAVNLGADVATMALGSAGACFRRCGPWQGAGDGRHTIMRCAQRSMQLTEIER